MGLRVLGRVCTALGNISLVFVILAATLNFLCEVMNEQQIMSVSLRLGMKCYYKSYYKREECSYKSVEFSAYISENILE